MKWLVFICMFMLSSCTQNYKQSYVNWSVSYKNDKQGKTLVGSKKQLIQAIRQGASVKIGWGGKGKNHSIEHLAEPIWIAVLDENEVIAHLAPQVLSTTNWEDLSANYEDGSLAENEWRVVITTKGEFDAIWINRNSHKVIKRIPQSHIVTWFVDGIDKNKIPLPLFYE